MGALTYDTVIVDVDDRTLAHLQVVIVDVDDRTLAHLQVVIVQRFAADRPVLLSWLDAVSIGGGRSSMWLTPNAPLHVEFIGSRSPAIDRTWLELLQQRAGSGSGLIVCDEKGVLVRSEDQRRVDSRR